MERGKKVTGRDNKGDYSAVFTMALWVKNDELSIPAGPDLVSPRLKNSFTLNGSANPLLKCEAPLSVSPYLSEGQLRVSFLAKGHFSLKCGQLDRC